MAFRGHLLRQSIAETGESLPFYYLVHMRGRTVPHPIHGESQEAVGYLREVHDHTVRFRQAVDEFG